jgi:hypothetical protein
MFRPSTFLAILTLLQVTGMCSAQDAHEFTLNGPGIAADRRTAGSPGGCPVSGAGGRPGRG